jgi:hypothetical protein
MGRPGVFLRRQERPLTELSLQDASGTVLRGSVGVVELRCSEGKFALGRAEPLAAKRQRL